MPSRAYVSAFGFKGPDQQKPAGVLSGGERNRLNLALTLKQGGNLILLDEPTNDLDVETLSSLENALLEFPGCAVVISHDRWFLDRVATHILAWEGDVQVVLVRGQLRGVREEQGRAARRRGGPPAPRHLPQAHPRLSVQMMRPAHVYRCPLRWSDMDAYGHVNNVRFLTYLEEARIDCCSGRRSRARDCSPTGSSWPATRSTTSDRSFTASSRSRS